MKSDNIKVITWDKLYEATQEDPVMVRLVVRWYTDDYHNAVMMWTKTSVFQPCWKTIGKSLCVATGPRVVRPSAILG
jgi:hypothetical protein